MAVNKQGRSGYFSVEDQPLRQRGPAYIKPAKLIPRRAKSQSRTADTLVGSHEGYHIRTALLQVHAH